MWDYENSDWNEPNFLPWRRQFRSFSAGLIGLRGRRKLMIEVALSRYIKQSK